METICDYLEFCWICFGIYCVGGFIYFVIKATINAIVNMLFKR